MTATDGDVNAALRRLQGEVDRLTRERDEAVARWNATAGASQRDLDDALVEQRRYSFALAASQAEAAKLREALQQEHTGGAPCFVDCELCELAQRAPGSREALREVVERAVEYARDADVGGYDHTPEWIVARLVPDAGQKGAEG